MLHFKFSSLIRVRFTTKQVSKNTEIQSKLLKAEDFNQLKA